MKALIDVNFLIILELEAHNKILNKTDQNGKERPLENPAAFLLIEQHKRTNMQSPH